MKVHKLFFYISLILLPVNLGKHFILNEVYINGRIIDYLLPAIYVPDILISLTLLFWISDTKYPFKHIWKLIRSELSLSLLVLFLVSTVFSVLIAPFFISSLYYLARNLLYFGLCIYIASEFDIKKDFDTLVKVVSIQVFLLALLAIAQWVKQGSLFDNYLFFGEQPYSYSTRNVIKENLFDNTVIPSYSIFRHPNTFGGYLAVVLVWIFFSLRKSKSTPAFYLVTFFSGVIALFMTLSYMAWIGFIFGIFFTYLLEKFNVTYRKLLFIISALTLIGGLSIVLVKNSSYVSLQRRSDLMKVNISMFFEYPIFGVGANNSTAFVEGYQVANDQGRFPQPVHNIFMLLMAESGVFATLFFVLFLATLFLRKNKFYLLSVTLAQIVFLGSVDHYFFTAHQTGALMWLTFGMALIQF